MLKIKRFYDKDNQLEVEPKDISGITIIVNDEGETSRIRYFTKLTGWIDSYNYILEFETPVIEENKGSREKYLATRDKSIAF